MNKKNIFENIGNGIGNTTVLKNYTVEHKEKLISDDYKLSDYASKKKTTSMHVHKIAFALGCIVDLIAFIQAINIALQTFKGALNFGNKTTEQFSNLETLSIIQGLLILFIVLLTIVLYSQGIKLKSLNTKGIYKSYYYNDTDLYKM